MIACYVRIIQNQKPDYLHNNPVVAEIADEADEKHASGDARQRMIEDWSPVAEWILFADLYILQDCTNQKIMESLKNSLNWFEIPVKDFNRAKFFYSTIFDYDMPSIVMGETTLGFL